MHERIDGFIFDLDGTVYLGEKALPGAIETLNELERRGKRIVFVSNKPLEPQQAYAQKLTRLGYTVTAERVITSVVVLGRYLAKHARGLRLYVIGEESLRTELAALGWQVVEEFESQDSRRVINPEGVDAIVVAFDRNLDYRKLNTAYQALVRGARFFATNSDSTCPMPGGAIPDAGATLAALTHMTGRQPEIVTGKPSILMMQAAQEILQVPANNCVLVGDRLDTDIRMGQAVGMKTAVVLTGITRLEDVHRLIIPPTWILSNLSELLDKLE